MKALFIAALLIVAAPAEASCRLALNMALDVSGSVDEEEYLLQMSGLAEALGSEDVKRALFAAPEAPVALAIFEWSSSSYQRIIQDWVLIATPDILEDVRAKLLSWRRAPAPEATGLGAALRFSDQMFARAPACWAETLDVSGDGKNNDWPIPERLRREGALSDRTVNALVVAREYISVQDNTPNGVAELSAYFRAKIIHGPGAFIEVALGFEDYAEAMQKKLLKELTTLPLGQFPDGDRRWAFLPKGAAAQ